jgi:ketosteroid isomerase-like protein
MRLAGVSAVALIMLAGCVKKPGEHAPVTGAEATAVAERAEASFTTGNVDAIMSQYANGAVMIDASNPTPSTDRKVQTGWAKAFVSMKPTDYHVPDRHIQLLGPDSFISSGTEMATIEAGAARPTISARFTDVFQRQRDGSWKIVHEHVSMPPSPVGKP